MSCLFPVTDHLIPQTTQNQSQYQQENKPKLFFQREMGNLARFPLDLTHFSVVVFMQQMLDPYKC